MVAAALERIVVQVTSKKKRAIADKAQKLGLPIAELMSRGADAYNPVGADEDLGTFADVAAAAALRAVDSVDDMLSYVAASEQRIADMEAKALKARKVG
jgi:hypothetical protein